MRFLAAINIFEELAPSTYRTTPLAAAYTSQSPLSAIVIHAYVRPSSLPPTPKSPF